jgi:hypothetical protein
VPYKNLNNKNEQQNQIHKYFKPSNDQEQICLKDYKKDQAQVAHACNPSYSGGRDQKDRSSKSTQATSSRALHKKELAEWFKV